MKFFKGGWLENQNQATQVWLKNQPTYFTSEVVGALLSGFVESLIPALRFDKHQSIKHQRLYLQEAIWVFLKQQVVQEKRHTRNSYYENRRVNR